MKNNKKLIIICITILMLIVFLVVVCAIKANLEKQEDIKQIQEKISSYTSINDFKTVEEVAEYLGCEYKEKKKSNDSNFQTDIYMKIKVNPYTDGKSNEIFYNKLISYVANVLRYVNFRIIDEENNIKIEVISEKEEIQEVKINGEANYFRARNLELQIDQYTQANEVKFNIQSNILKELVEKDGKVTETLFGTKDGEYDSYQLYFDEGIEVRKIENKIFNIVFTERYKDNLINNINTQTSKEKVIDILGEPTFEDDSTKIIGYKGEKIYIFFNTVNKQVSVYRVENLKESNDLYDSILKYEENNDISKLIDDVKNKWTDYDKYKKTSRYIELVYTLKGIKLQYNIGSENGVIVYNNYSGNIGENVNLNNIKDNKEKLAKCIYIKNENLVFLKEVERVSNIQSIKYMARLQKERNKVEEVESRLFVEYKEELQDDSYKVKIISLDGKYQNSELKENINSGLWISDRYYLYGIKNKGIYIYDAINRTYGTVTSGEMREYELKSFKNKILEYDDKSIKLNI